MNTTIKTILGITVAAAMGAALGAFLTPEKGAFLLTRIKDDASNFLSNFPASKVFLGKPDRHTSPGEMTSELIDMDQYETYTFKHEL
jgi:hypothetical protein